MAQAVPETKPDEVVVELRPIDWLEINADNPRNISEQRLKQLSESLAKNPQLLWTRPIIARQDGTVLAGNMRVAAALQLGWREIPVAVVEADDAEALRIMLLDNNHYGQWAEDHLAAILNEVQAEDPSLDFSAWAGFEPDFTDPLVAAAMGAAETGFMGDLGADPEAPLRPDVTGGKAVIDGHEYFVLSYNVTEAERNVILNAFKVAKQAGATTSSEAFAVVCREYLNVKTK